MTIENTKRVNVPFLDLKWQHAQIKDALKLRWDKILENTAFVIGDEVRTFEKNFAVFCNTKFAVGVSSGTDALVLALKALDLPAKSEVICLPTSFIASAEAIVHAGHIPKFSEVDFETGNYNYEKLESVIGPNTRAIMAVHLYGRMCDMDKIMELSQRYNLKVIEDAAQAQGATYKGQMAGSIGDVGCFSFYPGKNLGAYGQAGGVVTKDENIYMKVLRMRDHGSLGKYDHDVLGYNAKIDNLQAPVLDEKLRYLKDWNHMRRAVADRYYNELRGISEIMFISPNNSDTESVHHIFPIAVPERDKLMQFLKDKNIGTNIHYPQALHTFPYLQESGCKTGDFPISERLQSLTMSLPIFPGMTDEQVSYVINSIKEYFNHSIEKNVIPAEESIMPVQIVQQDFYSKLRIGVVGYGYWSPKVMNGFKNNYDTAVVYAICEKDKNKWSDIEKNYPGIKVFLNFEEMVKDSNIDAIVITTTVSSHYRIAKASLLAGKHVLVEKPMTEEVWEAEELINIAAKEKKTLMVDHTFLFMPAVRALKILVDSGELGRVHSVVGTRANLGLVQKDVDVVHDLAPHDFSILNYLFNEEPETILTTGTAPILHKFHKKKINAISSVTMKYKSGLYVNLFYSWLSPVKDRKVYIIGDKKMAVFDMLDKEGQLKVYDTKIEKIIDADPYGAWFNYKNGECKVIDLGKSEVDDLTRMAKEFIISIVEKREPVTSGDLGKKVVRSLKKSANSQKPKIVRYLGNIRNNLKRFANGNILLK